ncbi:TIGR02450 family Trp-rich protein [Pseudomonas sp. KCJK9016]|uniref:TIGR02450 family Trp-rich protein n=1 Tax=Pseudomonas sp. KCJK9016 TaxID=3344556 RepID=UPI0039068C42
MNRINPSKLLLSKWTAALPQNREKHFLVTELHRDEDGVVQEVELQAVLTRRCEQMDWHALQDDRHWRMGWR